MALTKAQIRAGAEALVEAEQTRVYIEPFTLQYDDFTVEDAYAIGQMVTEIKIAQGRVVKGHKVGLTSKAMREVTGATEPDYGTIWDNWFIDEGTQVSMSALNRPAGDNSERNEPIIEIEMVFVLKHDLGGPHVNAVDVINATDYVMPAAELCGYRFNRRGKPGVLDSIADAASCQFIILGGNPLKLTDFDIRHVAGSLYRNGVVEASGMATAVMGNPISSVAWLARKLNEFGVTMKAGHIVMSGSFIKAQPMAVGDSFVADYGPLGQISFSIVE
ncbi:MAG: 2-keto-4-pentenoate hydratase [Ilumatobacter sp.]